MIGQGELVVYRSRGIYRVEQIGKLNFSGIDKKADYFTLRSVENPRETVYIPAKEETVRRPVSKEQAMELIEQTKEEEELWIPNERQREQSYKQCIASGNCKEWLRLLKMLYGRSRRKVCVTAVDRKYLEQAEKALFSEFSFVLDIPEKELREVVKNA